jgi:hypothetical protein
MFSTTRISIETAAGGKADDQPDGLAFIKRRGGMNRKNQHET